MQFLHQIENLKSSQINELIHIFETPSQSYPTHQSKHQLTCIQITQYIQISDIYISDWHQAAMNHKGVMVTHKVLNQFEAM